MSTSSVWIIGGSSDVQRQKETGRVALCTQCKALPAMCGHLITRQPSSFIDEEMFEICNSWEGLTATAGIHVGFKREWPPGLRQRARLHDWWTALSYACWRFSLVVQKQVLCGCGCLTWKQSTCHAFCCNDNFCQFCHIHSFLVKNVKIETNILIYYSFTNANLQKLMHVIYSSLNINNEFIINTRKKYFNVV